MPLSAPDDPIAVLQRWADADLRSLNAQIEYLLRRALQESGRLRGSGEPAAEVEE